MAPDEVRAEAVAGEPGTQMTLDWKAIGAFLGVAVGDALGWPQERGTRVRGEVARPLERNAFRPWTRKAGGQYLLHDEGVLGGEFSDDTQLTLATARSLLGSSSWWHHFALRELPSWSVLERGGGGATKRAAKAWASGTPPWEQRKLSDVGSYFQAGGNGVAMRVMPHALRHASSSNFEQVTREVMANGVCTHGHPRALVGGLAFAFGAWRAFRQVGTLDYGGLIDTTIQGAQSWGRPPDTAAYWPTWREAADRALRDYDALWKSTVQEMLELLARAKEGIESGALAVDRDVLFRMGAFDKKVKGAGTIAAASALFLASRYAPDPILGVLEAAFADGADTDTVASMTGALLGALGGSDWLAGYARQVQDADYLRATARKLAASPAHDIDRGGIVAPISKRELDQFKKRLESAAQGDSLELPDGTRARITDRLASATRTKGTDAELVRLRSNDGQTFHLKIYKRGGELRGGAREPARTQTLGGERRSGTEVVRVGVRLPVADLARSRDFYGRVLGLTATSDQSEQVKYGGGLSIAARGTQHAVSGAAGSRAEPQAHSGLTIFIETAAVDDGFANATLQGAKFVRPMTDGRGIRYFQCEDPDGNLVEVFERRRAAGADVDPSRFGHDGSSDRGDVKQPTRAQATQARDRQATAGVRSVSSRSRDARARGLNLLLPDETT